MVNINSVNQATINQTDKVPYGSDFSNINYNGFDLCSDEITITLSKYRDREYNLNTINNPFIDGGIVLSHLMNQKSITLDFVMKGETKEALQDTIDEFKKKTAKTQGLLSISFGGDIRVIECSIVSDSYENMSYGSLLQNGSISFRAVDPARFYTKTPKSKTYQNVTSNLSGDITNIGTAETYPVYYIVFGDVVGTDEIKINLGGFTTSISQTINSNDVVIVNGDINSDNGGNVKINGTEVDYSGPIDMPLETGSNPFSIEINGTYTCNISVIYTKIFE